MWWQPIWKFIQGYWQMLLLALLSLVLAVPMAQEIHYKHRQTFFTRLAQIALVMLFAAIILVILLILTNLL